MTDQSQNEPQVIYIPPAFGDFGKYYRYRFFYGGRGGAKSWTIARVLVCIAASMPVRILCCREFQNSIADSAKKLIADQIEAMGLSAFFIIQDKSITSLVGGEFIFKGLARNEQSVKSTEGVDICWVEEAQTISQESLQLLTPTIRKPGSQIWFSFNPEHATDPIYRFMSESKEDEDVLVCKVNFSDNPWFPKELDGDRVKMMQRDPELYEHIWGGECRTISEAVVFRHRVRVEDFETPEDARFFHGVDWGFSVDPTVMVRCYIREDILYIDQEVYAVGVELDELDQFFRGIPTVAEWPIKADNARPETISHMARKGYNITAAEKWKGSVEDGVAYLKGFTAIVVHPRCAHTAKEFRMYSYKVDKRSKEILPQLDDKFNHCIDALRYALDGYIRSDDPVALFERLSQ